MGFASLPFGAEDEAIDPVTPYSADGDILKKQPIISLKGTDNFLQWMQRPAHHNRVGVSDLIEHALVRYAESTGFKERAPYRKGRP